MTSKEVRTRLWSVPQIRNNVDIVQVPLCLRGNQFGLNALTLDALKLLGHHVQFRHENVEWFLRERVAFC